MSSLLLLIINVVDILAPTAINFDVNNSWFLYAATIIRDALFNDFCQWWLIIFFFQKIFFNISNKIFIWKKNLYFNITYSYFDISVDSYFNYFPSYTSIWTCWFWISSMQNLMINVLQKDKSQIQKNLRDYS